MNVLHFLTTGRAGGIEVLVKDFANLSTQNNYYVFFWDGGWITDEMKKKGHNVIELHTNQKDFISPIKRLSQIIEDNKIDVIIAHHAAPVLWICMNILKKKHKHLKTIAYAHANLRDMYRENEKKGLWLRKCSFLWTYKNVDAVVAISKSVNDSFKLYGYKNLNKIHVIYNGVDLNKFFRTSYATHTPVRIAFAGRLVPEKGVHVLIEALGKIDKKIDFKCDIAGEGPERDKLEQLAKELKIDDRVHFHGVKQDMPAFLLDEDIFVHPARWEEGFGIALAEGMASGLLCIAFKKGAIPEIIDNEENGFIVEPDSVDALAKKLGEAIQYVHTNQGEQMRRNASKKAEKFSIQNYVQALDSLCENI